MLDIGDGGAILASHETQALFNEAMWVSLLIDYPQAEGRGSPPEELEAQEKQYRHHILQ